MPRGLLVFILFYALRSHYPSFSPHTKEACLDLRKISKQKGEVGNGGPSSCVRTELVAATS